MACGRREHRLPVVLSRQEVFELWRPLHQLRRRLLLMTAYSGGLRTYELVQLRVEDLDAAADAQSLTVRYESTLAEVLQFGGSWGELGGRKIPDRFEQTSRLSAPVRMIHRYA